MKGHIKDTGGFPSGATMRDLRREATRSMPSGDEFDVTTTGMHRRLTLTFGAKRRRARFFFDGIEYTATHRYIIHDKLNHTVTHSDGPRPAPMTGGQDWYEVANCYGEIHDSGF